MNYTVVKKLNENSNFSDFLILLEGKFYRLRRLNSIKFLDIDILSKYEKDFRILNSSGIMFPEIIDLKKETPELYYPYFHETRIDIEDNISISFISFMIKLFDNFVHNINFVPNCVDLDDFYVDDKKNYYYIAPIFKDLTKENIYKIKDSNEENLIKALKKIFNILKYKKLNNDKLIEYFRFIINTDINCVSEFNKNFERFFDYDNKINIRQPHYIGRSALMEKVVNEIKEEKPSKMLIYGKQRVGKTSFIQNISNKLNTIMSFKIFNVRNLEQLNENLSEYVNSSSQQKSIELNILEKIYFLQEKTSQKIVIIIDDYQEVEEEFSNFIDLISKSNFTLNFNLIIITHAISLKKQEKFDEFRKVEIGKFEYSEVEEMISSMMSEEFAQENQLFIENIYHHSAGLPGNIEEIMNELYNNKFIYFKNSEWNVDESNIKMKNFNDFVELKLKNIKRNVKKDIIDLSLLGNSFTGSEIKILSDITQKEYDLDKILSTKVIQKENSYYRFFNRDYWDQFHNKIDKKSLEKYHCDLYEKSYNFQKKIWHLKQVDKIKQIVHDYLQKIKDAYNNWSYIDVIPKFYQEIDDMDIKSDAILIYYVKYLIFSGNFVKAKKFLKYLDKKWMNFYRLRILAEAEPVQTLEKIEKRISNVSNPFENFYLKIIKGTILINSKYEDFETLKELKNELDILFEEYKENKPFVDLYLSFATDYGYYLQAINKRESQIVNSNTLTIAKNNNMKKHILNISLLNAHDYLDNSYLYESLTEDAISLSKSSNDLSKLPEVYLNKAYIHLYKGNIDDFFYNINESIKYSNILNNRIVELRAYGFKAFYYFYVDDMENIDSQIKKIKYFMTLDYKRLKNRAEYYYYYMSSLYHLRNKNRDEIEKISKIIDKDYPELNHINLLNEIFLADDKETVIKNTEILFKNDINLEEMMYLLNYKFLETKELKELFIVKSAELIKILKENGYRLSLSILYEGISNFFALKEDYLRAFKYLRLAIINFRNLGLEEKVKKLEEYFYKMIKFNADKTINEKEKMKLNKNFYDDIINISTKIISLDNIQEILDKTLNFLKNKFPVTDVFLRVETDMFESQSSTSYDFLVPSEEVFSIEPLEVFYVSKYNDFVIKYYMRNKNLMINLNLFESIFDTIILLDEYLSATLNRIIHQQNSIKDYLTGAYSRRYLFLRLEEEYLKSLRENSSFTVAMFDLDDFKKVNDQNGHKEGDRVLKFFVDTISNNIRNLDILGRYGGEEFVLILPKINIEDTKIVLDRIQEKVKENSKNIFGYEVTVSTGVCSSEKIKDSDYKKIISMADEALYKSKNNGKDQITVFDE